LDKDLPLAWKTKKENCWKCKEATEHATIAGTNLCLRCSALVLDAIDSRTHHYVSFSIREALRLTRQYRKWRDGDTGPVAPVADFPEEVPA
jgi:hypothetical protein